MRETNKEKETYPLESGQKQDSQEDKGREYVYKKRGTGKWKGIKRKRREKKREKVERNSCLLQFNNTGKSGFSIVMSMLQYEYKSCLINQLFEFPIVKSSPLYF